MSVEIIIPKEVYEELERQARRRGTSITEYFITLVLNDLDNVDKAKKYIKASLNLLERAKEEIDKGDLRQASEKVWGACALAIKAYALARDGKVLETHADLWVYKSCLVMEFGEWVRDVWYAANTMHKNFYENLADKGDVENALKHVEKLVKTIYKLIG